MRPVLGDFTCGGVIALAAALLCGAAPSARAEVRIEGDAASVHVTTSHDAISDVLSAFAAPFKVRYSTAVALDAPVDASYSGSIRRVIAEVLDGYNYVIKSDQGSIEIVVLGKRGGVAVAPAPVPVRGVASQWR
jgi:hypothetical protein